MTTKVHSSRRPRSSAARPTTGAVGGAADYHYKGSREEKTDYTNVQLILYERRRNLMIRQKNTITVSRTTKNWEGGREGESE